MPVTARNRMIGSPMGRSCRTAPTTASSGAPTISSATVSTPAIGTVVTAYARARQGHAEIR